MLNPLLRLVFACTLFWGQGLMGAHAQVFVDPAKAALSAEDPTTQAFYKALVDVHQKMATASGLQIRLIVADEGDINAYAIENNGERCVVLNWGLIEALQDDRDALAAVLAHEYAHHGKNHLQRAQWSDRAASVLGSLAETAVNSTLGTTGFGASEVGRRVGDVGAKVLTRKFSRYQEQEADLQGVRWMVQAGFNPLAAVRLQTRYLELAAEGDDPTLLRSHPPSEEREAALDAAIQADSEASLLTEQPTVALRLPSKDAHGKGLPLTTACGIAPKG
ncbi:MAG: hypothetical protein CFE43_13945 [Burkholderiales bacterium PBB3]|nr:MAG: hypothetical protein CFE43_13945 [Burkholderiales bacterium PBB3]